MRSLCPLCFSLPARSAEKELKLSKHTPLDRPLLSRKTSFPAVHKVTSIRSDEGLYHARPCVQGTDSGALVGHRAKNQWLIVLQVYSHFNFGLEGERIC